MKNIYLDHAATTKVHPSVLREMIPYFSSYYGNPSSIYNLGNYNKKGVEEARTKIKKVLDINDGEIYFTSGGTESNTWAIKGITEAYKHQGKHIITTTIEHHAVLYPCQDLEKQGFEVTYLPVDKNGLINIKDLKFAIKDTTILISIMYANNEIGTIQDINEIAKITHAKKIIFHTDAVQAIGHIKVDFKNIDLLSISSHKIYGPKGIGALYINKNIKIMPLFRGGNQENKKRAGTENVPGIIGLASALERLSKNLKKEMKREQKLRDYLIKEIITKIPAATLNGHSKKRLPNNVNISFEFIEGESIILLLNELGISTSSGSACTSDSLEPSHVLLATGLSPERAHGSLRVTIGEETTKADLDILIKELIKIVKRLREMSPIYEDYLKKGGKDVYR